MDMLSILIFFGGFSGGKLCGAGELYVFCCNELAHILL